MRQPKKLVALATAVGLLLSLAAPASAASDSADAASDGDTHTIVLCSTENEDGTYTHTATCDGESVTEYDYTWSIDPGSVVDNAPAETYSGDEPGDEAVYIAHDIYYYPELDTSGFTLVNYDGDQEWAYYYTAEGYEDFIFSTLPYSGGSSDTGSGISLTASEEETASTETSSITFTMSEQVNSFSGVTDYDGGDSDADTDTDTDTDPNTGADASGGFDSTEDSGTNEDGNSDDTTGSGSTHTHSYAAEVTTPATYTSEGVMTYTCSCGASYTETIAVITSSFLFDDVQDASASYYGPVYWAYDNGITTGTTATTFSSSKSCTRAQFVTFLWRLEGEPEPSSGNNPFTDVTNTSASYYKAVLWAVEKGVTNGTSKTTFSPSQTTTRAQAVTFLYRYAGEPAVSAGSSFTDVTNTSAFYYDAVQWAVANGITNGTSKTTFSPSNPCTRGQMVTFLYRFAVEPLSTT